MAYTIKMYISAKRAHKVHAKIVKAILNHKKFQVIAGIDPLRQLTKGNKNKPASFGFCLHKIRLKLAKPYCGNHAGTCPVGTPKPKMIFLEGEDWIEFNNFINKQLKNIDADVYSSELEIRRRLTPRVNYHIDINSKDGRDYAKWND